MATANTFLVAGIAFVLTLFSGVWLSRSGKPLKTGIFTGHKLIALATAILSAVRMYSTLRTTIAEPLLIALLVLAALCVVALFATGALISMDKPGYARFLLVHRLAIVSAVFLWPVVLLLVAGGPA